MSDSNQAAESSTAVIPPGYHGPKDRSKYLENLDLNKEIVELYKEKQKVYLKVPRGVDPKPYKIYQVLGNGQYKLSRDGKSDGKAYGEEDLQTVP